jgi:hypothetical protein
MGGVQMKILTVPRGTPAWHAARRGALTAGRYSDITGSDEARARYAGHLALDLLGDENHQDHEPAAPWHDAADANRTRCLAAFSRRHPTATLVTPDLVASDRHAWFMTSAATIASSARHHPGTFTIATSETRDHHRWARINAGLEVPPASTAIRIQAQLWITELPMALLLLATTTPDGQWLMTERPIYPDPVEQRAIEETALIFRLEVLTLAKRWQSVVGASSETVAERHHNQPEASQ